MTDRVRLERSADGSALAINGGAVPVRVSAVVEWWTPSNASLSRAASGSWAQRDRTFVAQVGPWAISIDGTVAENGVSLLAQLKYLDAGIAPSLRSVEIIASIAARTPAVSALRVAYCGAHSRSRTSRSGITNIAESLFETGWWVGALAAEPEWSVVLGAESARNFVTQLHMSAYEIRARQYLERWQLAESEEVALEPLWIATAHGDPAERLERYAIRFARNHVAAVPKPPCGWGSWGHWLERIDLGLMRETALALDGIASLRDCVRIIQIDDGWSELLESGRVSTTWRPNRRFPSGIAPLAAEIIRSGRECGLWLLPFTVNAGSAIIANHPEWLVADAGGSPLRVGGTESYCLDPTHPGAAAWLRELLVQLRDWGIRYLKLDHLRTLLAPDPETGTDGFDDRRRYFAARTRTEAYRAGLALIRDAVGPDVFLVACSAPAAPGAGLIDGHRIGPDIEPRWVGHVSGIRDAATALIANWFWQGRTWVNDPDYLLPCDSETHTRFWATVVAMSGGSMILSADLAHLAGWEEAILRIATPPLGIAARPIDLFADESGPTLLVTELRRAHENWTLLGVLNWKQTPCERIVALSRLALPGPVHVWDVWRGTHRLCATEVVVALDAEDAALFRITPVKHSPQVIGTNIHWAQGWLELAVPEWDERASELRVHVLSSAPRGGVLWIWIPQQWEPIGGIEMSRDRLIAVSLSPGEDFLIRFRESTSS